MAEQVIQPDKSPEQIAAEMEQTRCDIVDKVAALETQVTGTVQNAAEAISETVASVKEFITTAPGNVGDSVQEAASRLSESVRNAFDIRDAVRRNPWAAVGVSVLLGGVLGSLSAARTGHEDAPAASQPRPQPGPQPLAAATPAKPGVFGELTAMLAGKLREVAETAVQSITESMKTGIETNVPKFVNEAANVLTDTASNRVSTFADLNTRPAASVNGPR